MVLSVLCQNNTKEVNYFILIYGYRPLTSAGCCHPFFGEIYVKVEGRESYVVQGWLKAKTNTCVLLFS